MGQTNEWDVARFYADAAKYTVNDDVTCFPGLYLLTSRWFWQTCIHFNGQRPNDLEKRSCAVRAINKGVIGTMEAQMPLLETICPV